MQRRCVRQLSEYVKRQRMGADVSNYITDHNITIINFLKQVRNIKGFPPDDEKCIPLHL